MTSDTTPAFDRDDFFLREWPEALESRQFKQTTGALQQDGRFCCLGVACELLYRKGIITRKIQDYVNGVVEYDDEAAVLPDTATAVLGIERAGYYIDSSGGHTALITENDTGVGFPEIAKIIRWAYRNSAFTSRATPE